MSRQPIFNSDKYDDGRTKQAFKDDCDINKILRKAQRVGSISHLARYGGEYGDFRGFDFHEMQNRLARGSEIFEQLPSELRREFQGDPARFFEYANDPANVGRLAELLPEIAAPGNYFPTVNAGQRAKPAPSGASGVAASPTAPPAEQGSATSEPPPPPQDETPSS